MQNEKAVVARAHFTAIALAGDDGWGKPSGAQGGFFSRRHRSAEEAFGVLPGGFAGSFAWDQAERRDFHTRLKAAHPRAPVTFVIVALNLIVFILMALNGASLLAPPAEMAIRWGSNYAPYTAEGQWWRLFTSMFVHLGILHLALNMFALYQMGRMAERLYGSFRYLLLYLFAGLAGSMVSIWWHPSINSAGASGAIFGVFGGLLIFMLNPKNGVPRSIMNGYLSGIVVFIGYNLLGGFAHAGIDNGAHLGGLAGGIIAGWMLAQPLASAARKAVAHRIAATLLVGAAMLGALSYLLLHPGENAVQERRFSAALLASAPLEKQVLADTNDLVRKVRAKTIRPDFFATALTQRIAPQWEQMRQTLGEPRLSPDSASYASQQAFLRYLDDRIKACNLIADGIRMNDARLMARAEQAASEARQEMETIRKLIG